MSLVQQRQFQDIAYQDIVIVVRDMVHYILVVDVGIVGLFTKPNKNQATPQSSSWALSNAHDSNATASLAARRPRNSFINLFKQLF